MEGRFKRVALLSILSVTLAPGAFAAPWKHLGSDKDNTHYFYKPKTYHVKSGIASSWTKREYNVDVAAMAQQKIVPDDYVGTKSLVVFEEFNCAQKKKRTVVGKMYEGRDVEHDVRADWAAVQPGSIDEALLTALCKDEGSKGPAGP